jgi:hypothetical protein
VSDPVADFVAFLKTKFTSNPSDHDLRWNDGHDLDWHSSLLHEGEADTEGNYATAIDYTELLKRIDEFAAEFMKDSK